MEPTTAKKASKPPSWPPGSRSAQENCAVCSPTRCSTETLRKLLDELREDWQDRGAELVQLASGWRFRPGRALPTWTASIPETATCSVPSSNPGHHRLPSAGDPGDIEEIRGVAVSNANVIKALEERGWIDVVGHRETPGRPALFATTRRFLDDLGLRSLSELPPLEQIGQTLEFDHEA